jgi:mono/diheme cytochrome c family protein
LGAWACADRDRAALRRSEFHRRRRIFGAVVARPENGLGALERSYSNVGEGILRVASLFCMSVVLFAALGPASKRALADGDEVEHGRYLVRQVSMCIDCHGVGLTGGYVGHNPAGAHAPAIAGLPGLDVNAVAAFLQTGLLNGAPLPPPMPSYRMNAADAHAVAVYLKGLTPAPSPSP